MLQRRLSNQEGIRYFFFQYRLDLLVKRISHLQETEATKDDTTIENDKAIAVSLNRVPEMPSINISGKKTAIRINVVAVSYTHLTLPTIYSV